LALTGLLLFGLAVALPFLDVNVIGLERETLLLSGPLELEQYGVWELAVAVLVTSVGAPLARLVALTYVLLGMRLPQPPQHLYTVFRWFEWLRSWTMVEVFLGPVDKPVLAPARLERLGRRDTHVATGVTS
jgi:paraquat-inducible protein A